MEISDLDPGALSFSKQHNIPMNKDLSSDARFLASEAIIDYQM